MTNYKNQIEEILLTHYAQKTWTPEKIIVTSDIKPIDERTVLATVIVYMDTIFSNQVFWQFTIDIVDRVVLDNKVLARE